MTTPEPMTVQDVTRLLHAAVEAYGPDWVDPNSSLIGGVCKNTYELDGVSRHCIAGWVLTNHGHDLTGIERTLSLTMSLLDQTQAGWSGVMQDDAYTLLLTAQDHQDRGTPWGEVVTQALHTQKNPAKSEETNTDL
jgi:hypothetical protein